MAKIVDPDALAQTTDVVYDTTGKTIQILATGAISDDAPGKTSGVTGRCIYSFTKEEWKSDAALNKFKFPFKMIYEASFQLINGWSFLDQQTKDIIRDAGFQEIVTDDEFSCIISLGAIDAGGAPYYANVVGFDQTTVAFDKSGELNENILVFDGTADTRDYLKLFLREEGKLYAEYDLHFEQGLTALGFEAYKLPLSNGTDLKIVDNDATVSGANDPYQNMSIDYLTGALFETAAVGSYVIDDVVQDGLGRWFRCTTGGTVDVTDITDIGTMGGAGTAIWEVYPGERAVGTSYYAFNRIIDGDSVNTATKEEVHTYCQYQLRQATDINGNAGLDAFGTVNGNIAIPLTSFVGDQLFTNPGVYVDFLDANDNSNITYQDITVDGGGLDPVTFVPLVTTNRNNPFFASFTLAFSANLVAEEVASAGDTQFRMYFTNDDAGANAGNDFNTSGAIVVDDKDGSAIEGAVTSAGIAFQYAYDTNVQRGGGSANTPVPVTVTYQGLNDSELSIAEFTITRSTGLTFACNTPDELNYDNPA